MAPRVVNMIPFALSAETNQDSEPNIAVNPENPVQIAASAFTPDPLNSGNAPIFVSTDGGETWVLNPIVPSQSPIFGSMTGDITLRFVNRGGRLYAGILRFPAVNTYRMNVLRTADFTAVAPMTVLVDRDATPGPDQPYIQAATALGSAGAGQDRVFVGNNDRPGAAGGRTSTIDYHTNAAAATPPPPSGFTTRVVETRNTVFQDGFACRPALHWDGTVYVAFLAWRSSGASGLSSDVCVVRDDNWGQGASPFQAIAEPPAPSGDGNVGIRIVQGVVLPGGGSLGQQRRGSSLLSIAVDPRNSRNVYVAWGDSVGGANTPTLHVRRSQDGGVTWSSDIRTVSNALNPALAINSRGKVGFMYQQLSGAAPNQTWDTRLELTSNDWGSVQSFLLATTPSNTPSPPAFQPYIGDYIHLLALGKNFYGVFSANNQPVNANFPEGVSYKRAADFTTNQLFQTNGTTTVDVSIDPFFVRQSELEADKDFYVRDWTDSPTSADNGVEPSGNPWFFVRPDVWNRQTNTPGTPNANDQPEGELVVMGPGSAGDNWAFARIRRNESGSPASVTAHFLVSPLGTGSNYQNAGTDPDLVVNFGAAQLVKTPNNGYPWHLDTTATTHVCLAVEISTLLDPIVAPSLLGRAPGWPETDMSVLLDNNKAQRNIEPVSGASSGMITAYGLIHNAATIRRAMQLGVARPDGSPLPPMRVVGGAGKLDRRRGLIYLPAMKVGENRWLEVQLSPDERKRGMTVVVVELRGNTPVNGFALEPHLVSEADIARQNLRAHASVCWRLASAFDITDAWTQGDEAFEAASSELEVKKYGTWLASAAEPLRGWIVELVERSKRGDAFGVARAATDMMKAARAGTQELSAIHATLLWKLDAFQTMLQKDGGDPADILQTINWQSRVTLHPWAAKIEDAEGAVERSGRFAAAYARRQVGIDDYPEFLREELGLLGQLAAAAGISRERVEVLSGVMGDAAALQGAHRELLEVVVDASGVGDEEIDETEPSRQPPGRRRRQRETPGRKR